MNVVFVGSDKPNWNYIDNAHQKIVNLTELILDNLLCVPDSKANLQYQAQCKTIPIMQSERHYSFTFEQIRPQPITFASGGCTGVDKWSQSKAEDYKPQLTIKLFPPETESWEDDSPFLGTILKGYRTRNLELAHFGDLFYVFAPATTKPTCYHHADIAGKVTLQNHMNNGGCWTALQAQKLGKETHIIEISNSTMEVRSDKFIPLIEPTPEPNPNSFMPKLNLFESPKLTELQNDITFITQSRNGERQSDLIAQASDCHTLYVNRVNHQTIFAVSKSKASEIHQKFETAIINFDNKPVSKTHFDKLQLMEYKYCKQFQGHCTTCALQKQYCSRRGNLQQNIL